MGNGVRRGSRPGEWTAPHSLGMCHMLRVAPGIAAVLCKHSSDNLTAQPAPERGEASLNAREMALLRAPAV